jgi:hypothetical protein
MVPKYKRHFRHNRRGLGVEAGVSDSKHVILGLMDFGCIFDISICDTKHATQIIVVFGWVFDLA